MGADRWKLDIKQVAYTLAVERPDYSFERCQRIEDAILDGFPDWQGNSRVQEVHLGIDNHWYVTIYCTEGMTLEQDIADLALVIRTTK